MVSIIFLWIIIILLIKHLFKLIDINKNYFICFLITLLIILFFINLDISISAAINGAKLWFKAMLPTLFPFLVICNLLISFDGITLYSKIIGPLLCKPLNLSKSCSFSLVASFLCGYPLGAKYSTDLYDLGYISKKEYTRLLNIASNCGPLFILGSVSTAMLGNIKLGYLLLIANYLSTIIIGLFTIKNSDINLTKNFNNTQQSKNFGQAFKESIENAITTTVSVGGFIILFSVLIALIKNNTYITNFIKDVELLLSIPQGSLYAIILGSVEITNGCNLLATSTLSLPLKLSIISFLCSFSGISIIAQVTSFTSKHNISVTKYSIIKLLQGIISFIITFIISKLFVGSISASTINITNIYFPYKTLSFILVSILLISLIISYLKNKILSH